ncbi:FecR family protein [Flavobacterium jejuense]|uniref:FecR family protein n=1 Tax=Flavobacterium jejuense TaxID=1544455 RepID=A0ABX0IQG2_9FLAO|nr:FecR family protein [Flavobacterium jejuense]NHN25300.1 FecR family protein [Flavobacterium jejuense]
MINNTMTIFNKIITLSKQIASSLLEDKGFSVLEKSELFDKVNKEYIIKNLTDESLIKRRLRLINQVNKKKDWKKVKSKIDVPVRSIYWKYAVAALLLIGGVITLFINQPGDIQRFNDPVIVNNKILPGEGKAVLTLETGEVIVLGKGVDIKTENASSNGKELIYNNDPSEKLTYNFLTVPRGGQFQLTLSDGTKIWLNSESQLKYPVSFNNTQSRQVELVYGEAYFDVSSSTKHNGLNFKVNHNKQEVKVLGTEFNIKAYKDESNIYTTLVEGEVAVSVRGINKVIKPGEQSNFNSILNTIEVSNVDVFREVGWKYGAFSFKHKPLKEIMVVLSRWYDMEVIFENKRYENVTFNGTLYKNQSIEEVLMLIKGSINSYEINNKTLILK